jgi:hypothetical protein
MPSNKFLSNDTVGYRFEEVTFTASLVNESSALAGSAIQIPVAITPRAGRIVAAFIGVGTPAVSASGFVSGTVDAQVRINSAAVLSTLPAIAMAGSNSAAGRKATNAGGGVSGVPNTASSLFSAGAMISVDYNARSVGSAAAGAAGTGLYIGVTVRYEAL